MPRLTAYRDAMGDAAPAPVTFATLAAQVNRFGPAGAPAGYQFVMRPFQLDAVKLDPGLALVAVTIYLRRATDAYNQFHDAGSEQAIAAANAGFADPVAFVTPRLADVTQVVSEFADSLGLPAAEGASGSISPIAIAAGIGLVLWLWSR